MLVFGKVRGPPFFEPPVPARSQPFQVKTAPARMMFCKDLLQKLGEMITFKGVLFW